MRPRLWRDSGLLRARAFHSPESTVAFVASQVVLDAVVVSHDLAMNVGDADTVTAREFLGRFGCKGDAAKGMSSADSEEYLALVMYLVERSATRGK